MQKNKNKSLASRIIGLVITFGLELTVLGDPGKYELTLGGGGSSTTSFESNVIGVNLGVGVNVTDHLELGVRQDLQFTDSGGAALHATTGLAADWNLHLFKRVVPFVGVVGSISYGGQSALGFGPEVGLKFKLTKDTFLFGVSEYKFKLDTLNGPPVKDSVGYKFGIGLKF